MVEERIRMRMTRFFLADHIRCACENRGACENRFSQADSEHGYLAPRVMSDCENKTSTSGKMHFLVA
uniref:Uncharacterized protein n=1 Tax=Oryza nivara TaxID=4536 RepID=A0A0E0IIA8_ORYNI